MIRNYKSTAAYASIPDPDTARILVLDIETKPIMAAIWSIWSQGGSVAGLNMIDRDWSILSWGAKWLGENRIFYEDQRDAPDLDDDKELLIKLGRLLNEADIVVAHNGKRFDVKKINARMIANGLPPVRPYKVVDTMLIAKAIFAFTSNKLEYLADLLNVTYKKLKHAKYPGFELWKAVMKGDLRAWREMRVYNEYDVLSLEEVYLKLRAWDQKHPNVAVGSDSEEMQCPICGGTHLERRGFAYTSTGKFQRIRCVGCGAWSRDKTNLLTKAKRKALLAK